MNTMQLLRGTAMLLLAAAALGGAWYWQASGHGGSAAASVTETGKPTLTVRVGHAHAAVWPVTVTATGLVAPWQVAVIGAEVGGLRIATLDADIGTRVHAGQVLATLAADSVEAELQRLAASRKSAAAQLDQARSNVERARVARAGEAISDQQYDDYRIALRTAEASLEVIDAQLAAQRVVQAHTRILAVDDGVMSGRSATLGKVVQTGDELFHLIRGDRLEWQAEVDARQLAQVGPGQSARLQLPTGTEVHGRVRLAGPGVASASGRGIVYVSLPPGTPALPGMVASGQIEQAVRPALVVPQSALVYSDGISYLFEVRTDHHVTRHRIRVGRRQGGEAEVLEGLAADATIVTDGGGFLADGDLVALSPNGDGA